MVAQNISDAFKTMTSMKQWGETLSNCSERKDICPLKSEYRPNLLRPI